MNQDIMRPPNPISSIDPFKESAQMSLTQIHEHQKIIEEARARRLAAERRHAVPGCPWGCEGGWHQIALHEFGPLDLIPLPDPAVIILPWGLILFACECNTVMRCK